MKRRDILKAAPVSAAAGIALVTAFANLGGFLGPYTAGLLQQKTGSFHAGLICAGACCLFSASLAALLPRRTLLATSGLPATTKPQASPQVLLERS